MTHYVVTEVSARRFPWRVHASTKTPWSIGAGAFETREEAVAFAESLNKPAQSAPVEVAGIKTLGSALAGG